jgi:hypothetical protein
VARLPDGDPATGQVPQGGPPALGASQMSTGRGAPDDYAALLDAVRAQPAVQEWKERTFAALEPVPGAVLLDVGCGAGEDSALTRRVHPFGGPLSDLRVSSTRSCK